jgi:hypothetical protein
VCSCVNAGVFSFSIFPLSIFRSSNILLSMLSLLIS